MFSSERQILLSNYFWTRRHNDDLQCTGYSWSPHLFHVVSATSVTLYFMLLTLTHTDLLTTYRTMSSLPPPPSVGTTPTRRRQAESSNVELLSSIADDSSSSDDSKSRRQMHFQVGPLVISGAAIDRVRARFVSL